MTAAAGSNLPGFRALQLDFTAHVRDPEANPVPADIEPRRMRVYVDLVFNNVQGLLASALPVTRSLLADTRWRELVREFLRGHPSASPYFLEIAQEFLTFLDARGLAGLPDFLLELAHYEWVEVALDVAPTELPADGFDPHGDLRGELVVSPLVWPLSYRYPVHLIGPSHQPDQPPPDPTWLIVYRRPDLTVGFVESNALTHRLLELAVDHSGADALAMLAGELPALDRAAVEQQGLAALERLCRQGVILGARRD